jgi:hypothetical protein
MTGHRFWILVDGVVTPCLNVIAWATWFESADRQISLTNVGPLDVSTVFLGIDHNFFFAGPPEIFETMIFGDDSEDDDWLSRRIEALANELGLPVLRRESIVGTTRRYATLDEARRGHLETVALARKHLGLGDEA